MLWARFRRGFGPVLTQTTKWMNVVPKYQSRSEVLSVKVSWQDTFLRWGVVSTSLNLQTGGPPLVAVRDCLFNIFAATLHIGGRSSIRNPRTRHAVVTGTHLSRKNCNIVHNYIKSLGPYSKSLLVQWMVTSHGTSDNLQSDITQHTFPLTTQTTQQCWSPLTSMFHIAVKKTRRPYVFCFFFLFPFLSFSDSKF